LHETGVSLGADDETGFSMRLLHFRRTFVEKLFAIHGKIELFKQKQLRIGGYARHCYDLYQLAGQPDVVAMLQSPEYEVITADYDHISRACFARDYVAPVGMRFNKSDALFPSANLNDAMKQECTSQCRQLCYGEYPDWDMVVARFRRIQELL
jgi:hypothetical protein